MTEKSSCPFKHLFPQTPSIDGPGGDKPPYFPFQMKIFRLHPDGIRLERADPKLRGEAEKGAVKYCGPFMHANYAGWYVYPSIELDVMYLGDGKWDYNIIKPWEDLEKLIITANLSPDDPFKGEGRQKLSFGLSEPQTLQIWSGIIVQTPPGWCIHVRNPINLEAAYARPYHIQEGIIESDWLKYDLWLNIKFHRAGERVQIRQNMWPPIAQIVPTRREAYDPNLSFEDTIIDKTNPDGSIVWEEWQKYNYQKWVASGTKDSLTYHKTRKPSIQKMRDEGLIP